MDKLLDEILTASGLSEDQKIRFKTTFYKLFAVKTLEAVASVDMSAAERLDSALKKAESDMGQVSQILDKILVNPAINQKIYEAIQEVLLEITNDIAESATDSQKRQILASLAA